jgi:PadR family transcriptional regulator, regulatory protein PadR
MREIVILIVSVLALAEVYIWIKLCQERVTATRAAVLRVLLEKPDYALGIAHRFQWRGLKAPSWRLYSVLRSMEREGLLWSYDGESPPERGGRPRRYYRLTESGEWCAKRKTDAQHHQQQTP